MIHTTPHEGDITVVRPGVARITAVNSKAFKDEVTALIDEGSSQLIIDFKEVSFVDSAGLGALVGILKRIGMRGELLVCGLNSEVAQMFNISRMDRVFSIHSDVAGAIQAVSEES